MTAEDSERRYEAGSRMANILMLQHILTQLGRSSHEWTEKRWVLERELTISMLRRVCAEHGDNDWPDDLHLADIIEKHLARYLDP